MQWGEKVRYVLERWAGWAAWIVAFIMLVWLGMAALVREYGWSLSAIASFGPFATAATAAVALVIGVATIRQKATTDRRDQWWKRVQWALDKVQSSTDAEQAVALAALTALLEDESATEADAQMLLAAVDALDLLAGLFDDESATIENVTGAASDAAKTGGDT